LFGTVSGQDFFDFLWETLIPNMMCTNPHSIIIMDNCSMHAHRCDLLHNAGILVLFLPSI